MTKEVRITLEDLEHKILKKQKGKATWKEFLMRKNEQKEE